MTRTAESTAAGVLRRNAGLLPFLGFGLLFLGVPLAGVVISAFLVPVPGSPGQTAFGWRNVTASLSGASGEAMLNSLKVSFTAALVATIIGAAAAQAIVYLRSARLNTASTVLASVLANSGGISLAFSFIVLLGSAGFLTQALNLSETGFTLYGPGGLVLMYQYFLIPTMVMLFLPTLNGVRREWHEAAASLGATSLQFWTRIGIPVISPALLSGFVLLFGAAFATHVSAAALIGGANFPLVTLKIAGLLSGGSSSGQENMAMALSMNMILAAVLTLAVSLPLQKRSRQWLSSK